MKTYFYNIWEILSNETLDFFEDTKEIDSREQVNTTSKIIVFKGEKRKTKKLTEMAIEDLESDLTESIEKLYKQDAELYPAINIDYFDQDRLEEELCQFLDFIANGRYAFSKKRVHLLALGDVGGQLATGLKLLGGDVIHTLGIYDINPNVIKRYEIELNQIAINPELKVTGIKETELFDADVFLFCASKYVPKVGEAVSDVRMAQFEDNSKLVAHFAKIARERSYKGIFGVVSDPVDLLCLSAYHSSNLNDEGIYDYRGLLPEQVVGFGLGVMDARAKYYSDLLSYQYPVVGRAYGPHGKDLVIVENVECEAIERSIALTERVITANLEMRALGFKPFIAPALSSGAISIVRMLAGEYHYSANYLNGIYWGALNRRKGHLIDFEKLHLPNKEYERVKSAYDKLEALWNSLMS